MLSDRERLFSLTGNALAAALTLATDGVGAALGPSFSASTTFPVAEGVGATEFIRLFLDQIFFAVNGVLVMLAVLLVFSLLLSDVEEKTFEYGMLRSLGMPHAVLIVLLAVQAAAFAAPGILIGLLVCFVMYVPLDLFFATYAAVPMVPTIQTNALIAGLGAP